MFNQQNRPEHALVFEHGEQVENSAGQTKENPFASQGYNLKALK